jgi:UDP-2,3-diacylglucosamine pyrophosphatase LpxH
MIKNIFITFAITAPLLLAAYMLGGHGTFEDVMLYSPTLRNLLLLLILSVLSALSYIADKMRNRTISGMTLALSSASIVVTLYFASCLILPKYIRQGEISPRNFLVSTDRKVNSFRFASAGDAHIGARDSRTDLTLKMIDHIKNDNYDAFFLLGDLVQLGFNDSMWKKAFKDMYAMNKTVPACYVPGNHDTMFGGDELYRSYSIPDKNGALWRRIDIGNIHFLILDIEWITQTYTKAQEKWLVEQLKSIPAKDWCIVMSHTFYYCSGEKKDGWQWYDNKPLILRLTPLFERYGVDLVMSGHMHQTEVLKMNGVTYAVMGSFGGKLDRGRTYTSPASVWYKAGQFGFADVSIQGDNAVLRVRDPENKTIYSIKLRNR